MARMQRSFKSTALAACLTLLVSACGSGEAQSPVSPNESAAAPAPAASTPASAAPVSVAPVKPGGRMPTLADLKTIEPCALITAEQWSAALVEGGFKKAKVNLTDDDGYIEGFDERICLLDAPGSGLPLEMWSLRIFTHKSGGTPRPDLPGYAVQVSPTEVQYQFGELALSFFNFPAIEATGKLYEHAVASFQKG